MLFRSADIEATKDRGNEKEKAIKDADRFEVILEAHAPKIIIPQDSSSDKGYCLLDTGYLAVKVKYTSLLSGISVLDS